MIEVKSIKIDGKSAPTTVEFLVGSEAFTVTGATHLDAVAEAIQTAMGYKVAIGHLYVDRPGRQIQMSHPDGSEYSSPIKNPSLEAEILAYFDVLNQVMHHPTGV